MQRIHRWFLTGVILLILTTVPAAHAQTECSPVPAGLVSWWPGDGNANDIVDDNDGALENGAAFDVGFVGQAFLFDGNDDFVEIDGNTSLRLTQSLTIEAWTFKESSNAADIVSKYFSIGSADNSYRIGVSGGKYYLQLGHGGTPNTSFVLSNTPVVVGEWTHLAGVYDGASMKLYINGTEDAMSIDVPTEINPGSTRLRIGAYLNCCANRFDGLIDEAAIFDRALSAPEIQAIFDAGSAGKCKSYDPEPCRDGVPDSSDNCLDACNSGQDDTDNDDCGNLCDADYDQSGVVGFPDFGQFVAAYGSTDMEKCHVEPIPGCTVGFPDFGTFVSLYGSAPGPSATTVGTTACP